MRRTLAVLALTLVAAAPSRTVRWTLSSPDDYQRGTLENVAVASTGELSLGPSLTRHDSGELAFWSSAVDEKSGTVYFGSGTEGKLYALRKSEFKELANTGQLVITALAFGPGDKLYAATIPAGKIFVLEAAEGKLVPWATIPDAYVWALAAAGEHLLAGTGPEGKIYRIDAQGKFQLWFETRQSHVLSLAPDRAGAVYAGTSPNGVLFRIPPEGKGEVVFHTDEQEIRALAWDAEILWLGANKSKRFDPKRFVRRLQAAAAQAQEGEQRESPFQELFEGSVYRMAKGEPARLAATFGKSYLTTVAVDKRGAVYVGTGDGGMVWRLRPDGPRELLARLKESQAMTLPMAGGELAAIGAGNPGAVAVVSTDGVRSGSFTSEILDAKFPALWGTLSWDATGRLTVQTRSGRTARPDEGTWTDWSEPLRENPSKVSSPPGRFFQVCVTWKEDPKAVLRWITLFYRTENQQPEVKDLEVEAYDDHTAFLGKLKESPEVVLRWKASDPDGDELLFRVYAQREGREEWVPLSAEPTPKRDFKWNSAQAADGWYRLKLEASDELTNAGGAALKGVKVTPPVLVDNRKPSIEGVRVEGGQISWMVTDGSSVVARVEVQIDSGAWQFVQPEDGLYDQKTERFTVPLPGDLAPGVHHLTFRAMDAGGNLAAHQEFLRRE